LGNIVRGVPGQYEIRIELGGHSIQPTPSMVNNLSVVSSIDKLLPSISMSLNDEAGILTHIRPADSQSNAIALSIGSPPVTWNFEIFRRFPTSANSNQAVWEVEGFIKVQGLFSPTRQRSFMTGSSPKTVKNIIEQIASEIGCSSEVDPELDYVIPNILQPNWSNAQFLFYLKTMLKGKAGGAGYYCFIRPEETGPKLVFKSLSQMLNEQYVRDFIYDDQPKMGSYPMYNLDVIDNYALLRSLGTRQFSYGYFDYFTGRYTKIVKDVSSVDMPSLSEFILVNKDDPKEDLSLQRIGRKTEFTDFSGLGVGKYYKRLNSLVQSWFDIGGDKNLFPGMIVKIFFPQSTAGKTPFSYQYGGFWMIERVNHTWVDMFRTRLLLTRCGIDTELSSNLLRPKSIYLRGRTT